MAVNELAASSQSRTGGTGSTVDASRTANGDLEKLEQPHWPPAPAIDEEVVAAMTAAELSKAQTCIEQDSAKLIQDVGRRRANHVKKHDRWEKYRP